MNGLRNIHAIEQHLPSPASESNDETSSKHDNSGR